jgi:radical SAM protein with 4Fe4S-binding SPASM domain
MTWDGRMLPCGMMPGPAAYPLKVGFDQAWEQLREMTREIRMPAKCMRCDKRDVCLVCAAVCVTETGSFDGVPEYVCRQTEEMIRLTREAYQERIKNGN